MKNQFKTYQATVMQARAMRNLRNRLSSHLKKHGLTVMEWALLGLISEFEKKKVSITDLARMLDVKTALTSVMVDKQVKSGLLQKAFSPTDSRLRYIKLTPKGRASVKNIEGTLEHTIEDWLPSVEEKDMLVYRKVMSAMADANSQATS